ncbi:MAG: PQQ-binding-like beta-propeller repeat protein, partial [Verrucomicrobiota bacterium]
MDFRWVLGRLGLGVAAWVSSLLADEDWPRFRGPNGQGVAAAGSRPPVAFGPTHQVAWQTPLPPGNASPAIRRGRIFTTGFQEGRLVTCALEADSGRELWRREVTPPRVEEVHPSLGSPASATPALDDGRVFVFFGSLGLLAYDWDGRELWRHERSLPQTEYGASSSPVVAGDLVVQLLDQDGGSYLLALDKRTGREAWRVDRPEM